MIQRIKSFIKKENLFLNDDHILLAVSGGIDSVVMTELFQRSGFRYAIAHCNFQLRGKESDEDALFVEKISKVHKVDFYIKHFDTKKYSTQNRISVQMAARQLRMNWFEGLIKEKSYQYYTTAHHQDDQIETLFINLIRGTGISGLHGILPKHGQLIHPMLFTNRKEIEKFAEQNKIRYREDSSNQRSNYTRNKIRNQLLPIIREINPEYIHAFTHNIERFRQAEMIYLKQIDSVVYKLISHDDDQIKISIALLSELEQPEIYLYELISPYEFNYSDVRNIIASINGHSGKVFFSNSFRLFKDRDYLIIEPNKVHSPFEQHYEIQKGTKKISEPVELEFELFGSANDLTYSDDKRLASFDADKLSYPLKLKKWDKGDYFYPLGMKNKKLISDFFIDSKLSIPEKEKTWLLTSGDHIIWIIGHRIDNRYKVTPETQNILRIQFL